MIIKLRNFFFYFKRRQKHNTQNEICNEYIKLSKKGQQVIKNKEMLTYISIDACQRILRKQFNVHFVLQDTILGPKLKLKEQNEKTCINYLQQQFSVDHHERFQLRKE